MKQYKVGDECPPKIREYCSTFLCGNCSKCNTTIHELCLHCSVDVLSLFEETKDLLSKKVAMEI